MDLYLNAPYEFSWYEGKKSTPLENWDQRFSQAQNLYLPHLVDLSKPKFQWYNIISCRVENYYLPKFQSFLELKVLARSQKLCNYKYYFWFSMPLLPYLSYEYKQEENTEAA